MAEQRRLIEEVKKTKLIIEELMDTPTDRLPNKLQEYKDNYDIRVKYIQDRINSFEKQIENLSGPKKIWSLEDIKKRCTENSKAPFVLRH